MDGTNEHDPQRRLTGVAALLDKQLPVPPDVLRRGPFAEGAFTSEARSERTTSLLGVALGVSFGICFLTGLVSHFIQQPVGWFPFHWGASPAWGYRFTQGLHVITGLAAVPLLLGKLWSVIPKLFTWPPARTVGHGLSRLGLFVLVGAAIFQLLSGVVNLGRYYAVMPFFFTDAHYWAAWIAIGALLVHIGSQLPVLRRSLGAGARAASRVADAARTGAGLSRRGLLGAVGAGVGVVTLATAGQTIGWLAPVSVLSPRDPRSGAQGLPVNKTAASAGVTETAMASAYALKVEGPQALSLSRDDLVALPQTTLDLPLACVEGWSGVATWTGVRLRDLLAQAGVPDDAEGTVSFESLQEGGRYRASEMPLSTARGESVLLALQINGSDLDLDHGFPVRLIAPNRPGVLQTKWLATVKVEVEGA